MDWTSFLIPLIFSAVILYKIYKKKNNKNAKDKENNSNTKDLQAIDINRPHTQAPVHRIYVQAVDFDKTSESKSVSVQVETAITDYLADIDRMGAVRPIDIKFFTNYNRIFIVYVFV